MRFIPERRTWIRGTNATEARSIRPLTTKHDGLELGEGGPSVFEAPLAELRQSAVREAYNITSEQLEPEQWANGRMSITFERQLAHEYEGFRHKLTEHVAAQASDVAEQVSEAIS